MVDETRSAPEEMPPSYPPKRRPKQSLPAFLGEMAMVIAAALLISVLVKTFLVQAFYIPSPSMTHTLEVGDRIIVNKLANSPEEIHRGDVVVFVDPGGWLRQRPETEPSQPMKILTTVGETIGIIPKNSGHHLVKRVIGVGGDHVSCCGNDGRLQINGEPIDEPYLRDGGPPSTFEFEVTVPEGHVWVMGDNRSNSEDSRAHMGQPGGGFVPVDNIEGRVTLIMLPFDRFGPLDSAEDTFKGVPAPSP